MLNTRKKVLLLSRRDFLTLPVIRSLDPAGYRIFVMGPAWSPVRFSRFHEGYFALPGDGPDSDARTAALINALAGKFALDAVIPLDLDSTVWISENRHALDVPSLPLCEGKTFLRLHDKWRLTETLDALSIRYPKTVLVETPAELAKAPVGFPFMVKPLNLEAGKGIVHIGSARDLEGCLSVSAEYEPFPVLAQSYVDGADVGMSALVKDGEIVTWTTQRSGKSWTVELFPDASPEAFEIGAGIAKKESYSGFFHIDFVQDSKTWELFVLELNPRLWSSVNASILNGYDFIGDAVALALGTGVSEKWTTREPYSKFRRSFLLLLRKPFSLRGESDISRGDLFSVLTDPVPYFLLAVVEGVKRIFGKCRRTIKNARPIKGRAPSLPRIRGNGQSRPGNASED